MTFLPDCRDMSRLISDSRDSGRFLGIKAHLHLWICDTCRRFRAQLKTIGRAVSRAPQAGPALSAEARQRLRKWNRTIGS